MALKPFTAPGARIALRGKAAQHFRPSREGEAEIILDISRLLSRSFHATPTGIDRVEYVYARELLDRMADRLAFAAVHPAGGYYGRLDKGAVRQFLAFTSAKWQHVASLDRKPDRGVVIKHLIALRPRPIPKAKAGQIYLQVSPHHLTDREKVGDILRCEGAKFVALVHDVIPLSHPEFARPQGAEEHLLRVQTMDDYASGLIGNSQATIDALIPHLKRGVEGRHVGVAHFGADPHDIFTGPASSDVEHPYFIYIATIEPRKNHLLLLNIWRRLIEVHGAKAPKLILVGRRGWENENVIDILERGDILRDHVIEAGELSDKEMSSMIAGARAMVMPSFVEGFGMPVIEALSAGVPVICSDIAAHREVGGDAPDYLDPLDGLGWMRAIEDFSEADSSLRSAQLARLEKWQGPNWSTYFDDVIQLIEEVAASHS